MDFNSVFITGTDTGIGKTTVTCGIAAVLRRRGFRVGVLKPVETGCEPAVHGLLYAADAARLRFFSGCELSLQTICPYMLREPLAPALAAERNGMRIDIEEVVRCHDSIAADHDITLIEGAGGLLVPLAPSLTFTDLAVRLRLPVLVVVGSRLGAVNHALLTMRYARFVGLRVLGYVVNFLTADADLAAQTNAGFLADWLGPPLGIIPHLGSITETPAERERLADLFSAQLSLDPLLLPTRGL